MSAAAAAPTVRDCRCGCRRSPTPTATPVSIDEELVGLFDLSHDAFCIAGFDGYLRRANPAFAAAWGT
jgi:hypothetical protein